MPLDASIYQNIKPVEMPSFVDSQAKAMNLSQLAMQNQGMQKKLETEDKDQKYNDFVRKNSALGNSLESMSGLSPEERAMTYPKERMKLIQAGIIGEQDAPAEYDDGFYKQSLFSIRNNKDYLEKQKLKAETAKYIADANKKSGSEYDPIKQLQYEKLKDEIAAKRFAKTPEGRLKGLSGTDKQRLDNAKLGLITTQGMADALKSGDNTFSLIGDNDFTQQRTLFEEALGRMQSGGAISKEEEKRFRSMAPTATDSSEMQQKKLSQLQSEMNSRLSTLGFTPEEVGIASSQTKSSKTSGMPGMPSAEASDMPKHGTVEDGYVFMGGDAANPKNWKRAK